jgi:hypothetical protein
MEHLWWRGVEILSREASRGELVDPTCVLGVQGEVEQRAVRQGIQRAARTVHGVRADPRAGILAAKRHPRPRQAPGGYRHLTRLEDPHPRIGQEARALQLAGSPFLPLLSVTRCSVVPVE